MALLHDEEGERAFARNLLEAMPGLFYLYNEAGRFRRWNRNLETVTGYTAAEIAEMHPLAFFGEGDQPVVERRMAETFEVGTSSVEASLLAKNGTSTPYLFTGNRISFDGETCLAGVGIDLTVRRRAELALARSEERYRTTLESIHESCQLLDFDLRYLYLNDAAAVQNRRPNVELLGNTMQEVWPGIETTAVFRLLERCTRERIHLNQEIEFTFVDGATGWFDVRTQPVREGIFVMSIDITERKEAERALHELNESLERKVAERTADLELARERAESADRLKSAFLATMSHELRTPLNSIIGFTGIMLQELAGPLVPEQAKQLGMVQISARHLLALINDVLDLSKIEAGQLVVTTAPFDLRASIDRVIALVAPLANQKGLVVRVVAPDQLDAMHGDQRRVEQILINLINNAIKFTDHGEVTLALEIAGPDARIRVSDTGIGIKSQDLALLFQPFHQLDSGLQRRHEGTGLGLAICRRLTDLLGGAIGATSEWGRGSTFWLQLPMNRSVPA